jgi:hypothetical protein
MARAVLQRVRGQSEQVMSCARLPNSLPTEFSSLERIQAYLEIDHEPKPSAAGVPPAAWPTSGELQVEKDVCSLLSCTCD